MKTEQHSKLFPCKNRKLLFPHLDGLSFQIHSEITFDALCVWGGPLCTFDAMVKFVNDRSIDPVTKGYQFGLTGMIAQIPPRMTTHIRPTITISEAPIILLKFSNGLGPVPIADSFQQVTRGFVTGSWILIISFLIGLFVLVYLVSIRFTGSFSPFVAMSSLLVHEELKEGKDTEESANARILHNRMYRTSLKLISVIFGMFVMIVALFYEVRCRDFFSLRLAQY